MWYGYIEYQEKKRASSPNGGLIPQTWKHDQHGNGYVDKDNQRAREGFRLAAPSWFRDFLKSIRSSKRETESRHTHLNGNASDEETLRMSPPPPPYSQTHSNTWTP